MIVQMESLNEMDNKYAIALKKCLLTVCKQAKEEGARFPATAAVVWLNGSAVMARCTDVNGALAIEFLAVYEDSDGFRAPVNIFVIDARGESQKFAVPKDDGYVTLN